MKLLKHLLLFIFLAILTLSVGRAEITCTESQTTTGSSLLSPGGPLAGFELQDQDGLGTCYANALSAMLEASLPGHPHLSYQQLAVYYGNRFNSYNPDGSRRRATYTDANGQTISVSEGGFTCSAFLAVKDEGRVCSRDEVPLERMGYVQGQVVRSLSNLYDGYATLNGSDGQSLRENLQTLASTLQTQSAENCNYPLRNPNPTAITGVLEDHCVSLHTQKLSLEANLAEMQESLAQAQSDGERSVVRSLRSRIREIQTNIRNLTRELRRFGTVATSAVPIPGKNGVQVGQREIVRCQLNSELTTDIQERYYRALERDGESALNGALRDLERRHHFRGVLTSLSNPADRLRADINLANPDWCRSNQALAALRNPTQLRSTFYELTNTCLSMSFSEGLSQALFALSSLNGDQYPNSTLLTALARLDDNFDDYLLGLISPQCLNDTVNPPEDGSATSTSHPIPSDLDCNSTHFPTIVPPVLNAEGEKDSEAIAAAELEASRAAYRSTINDAISNNKPVSVEVCTAFFSDPNADSQYARNCTATGTHAMHAMVITGHRCVNGQVQYQVQNSWGQQCGYLLDTTSTPESSDSGPRYHYECNQEGGYFWVPEDSILKNTQSLNVLGPPRPRIIGPGNARNRQR